MKQNICELDTMIFFREALEAHEFMLLPVMARIPESGGIPGCGDHL